MIGAVCFTKRPPTICGAGCINTTAAPLFAAQPIKVFCRGFFSKKPESFLPRLFFKKAGKFFAEAFFQKAGKFFAEAFFQKAGKLFGIPFFKNRKVTTR
ncbi:hypothetical protein D3Z39_08740 [Anaerotruncus colihominis]|uniref:Uncharacterized protein n=1 Tax=Anaerotruncus colihominis TaxID=169435 RepID=A0A845RJF1_9FIRM|nr:hypothetical protein [Anaerotruncus colihominis]NBI78955.1 hypothetical protein [Anaerotruncus colihominis]